MQMVFQDPYSSLNPRKTVGSIIADPFVIHGLYTGRGERKAPRAGPDGPRRAQPRALQPLPARVLRRPAPAHRRRPRDRARAEGARSPTSRCRRSTSRSRRRCSTCCSELQREMGLTLVFIAHDLSVVRHMCDRVAVMYLGKIVEIAESDVLYATPRHPYTGALLSAVPVPDPPRRHQARAPAAHRRRAQPGQPALGCRFHTRCPKAQAMCSEDEPPLERKARGYGRGLPLPADRATRVAARLPTCCPGPGSRGLTPLSRPSPRSSSSSSSSSSSTYERLGGQLGRAGPTA